LYIPNSPFSNITPIPLFSQCIVKNPSIKRRVFM
jgi:hypothetical protein